MLGSIALCAALLAAAPGDLIRCVGSDGSVRWQDRPCAREERSDTVSRARDGNAASEMLRRRLEDLRAEGAREVSASPSSAAARRATPAPAAARASAAGAAQSVDTHRLAVCSEAFLACAHHDDARMDRCIAGIPACGANPARCCPRECTAAYARERAAGATRPDAVYLALLAPDAGGCGPAPP